MSEGKARSSFRAQFSDQPLGAVVTCAILCLMPAAFALITWQPNFEYTAIRHYSLPVLVAEALIIVIAMTGGFGIFAAFAQLRLITKAASIIWLAAVLLATFFASADPAAAQTLCLTAVIHSIFVLAMIDRFSGPWRSARALLIASLMLGLAAFTVVVLLLAWTVTGDPDFEWIAFGAGVSNVRHLGYYGLALTGLAAGVLAVRETPRILDWPVLGLLIGFFLIDWSGGRAAFCASIVIIIFVCLFADRKKRVKFLLFALPLFVLAIPFSTLAAPDDLFGAGRIFARLFGYGETISANSYSSNRIDIWVDTWRAILDRPWVGHGDGQLRYLVEIANKFNHPHNAPLQFLYGWGVIGAGALAVLLYLPALNMIRAARENPSLALPAIGSLAGLGAMSLLDGSLYYPLPVMICLIALIMLHSITHARPPTAAKPTQMEGQS